MKKLNLNKQVNFLLANSDFSGEVKIESLSSYDIQRYIDLCQPFMDAVQCLGVDFLYPERIDNVVPKKPRKYKKTTINKKMEKDIKDGLLSDKNIASIYRIDESKVFFKRKKIKKMG